MTSVRGSQVIRDGRVLRWGGPKQRAVLALIPLPNTAVCWATMSKSYAGRDLG
jgi:hypothetical protein